MRTLRITTGVLSGTICAFAGVWAFTSLSDDASGTTETVPVAETGPKELPLSEPQAEDSETTLDAKQPNAVEDKGSAPEPPATVADANLKQENDDLRRKLARQDTPSSPPKARAEPKVVKSTPQISFEPPPPQKTDAQMKLEQETARLRIDPSEMQSAQYSNAPLLLIGGVQPQDAGKKIVGYEVHPGVDYNTETQFVKGFGVGKGIYLIVEQIADRNNSVIFRTSRMGQPVIVSKGSYLRITNSKGDARYLRFNGVLVKSNAPERPFASFDLFAIEGEE
ncbi:hypothetical protein LPB140_10460 [Sphingorhabdus lutea]|uniref:Uncharacterized protein n=1 Tax=Sphingorhabdus lutea TaxID=1913578 RepID=A0A1L3JDG2_9SPHN|nr:hypothetical protein LPB140_10460 [Sphingorhabdus lutea]